MTHGRCSEQVWDGFFRRACTRRAAVEREGKHYCKQHDPVARKEKLDRRIAARRAVYARVGARHEAEGIAIEIADHLSKPGADFALPPSIQDKVKCYAKARKRAKGGSDDRG